MKRSGSASLPLHGGRAPRWLFEKMERLAKAISEVIIDEYSQEELLQRLSDPYWFQSFACVLGYDWHSSGTTTVTCGALKEALSEKEHGIRVVGGKGKTSRKAPDEIMSSDIGSTRRLEEFVEASKISAQVDSNCLQDSYNLYHHSFIFDEKGNWITIQQGMNPEDNYARRYHWTSSDLSSFLNDPHRGISTERKEEEVLNLASSLSKETRKVSLDLVKDNPAHLERYVKPKGQSSVFDFSAEKRPELKMPSPHQVSLSEVSKQTLNNLEKAYQKQPKDYKELISTKGVGAKSLRALALIAELVYGTENDWQDPAKYSYAHGGKDGYPRPVGEEEYENSINVLKEALEKADVKKKDKLKSLEKLKDLEKNV
ncbi:MAG: DUF763 domain-containing protein [Candidatus Aenigmatarchaeota archaeon]